MKLTLEQVKELCPGCAKIMESRNIKEVEIDALMDSEHFKEAGFSQGLCEKLGGDEGFFTRCAEMMSGKVDDEKAFCAALHKQCIGKYPAQESISFTGMLLESEPQGKELEVVLIEAGFSANRHPTNNLPINYSRELLSNPETLRMFEGVPLYAYEFKGDSGILFEHLPDVAREKAKAATVLNKVGVAENVRFGEFSKPDGSKGFGIIGKAKIFHSRLAELVRDAFKAGVKNVVGFSIDAIANMKETIGDAGKRFNEVTKFLDLPEVTVVDKPGAGGIILRVTASAQTMKRKVSESVMYEKLLALLRQTAPHIVESITDAMPEEERAKALEAILDNKEVKEALSTLAKEKAADGNKDDKSDAKPLTLEDVENVIAKRVESILKDRNTKANSLLQSREMLAGKVKESGLPQAMQDEIVAEHYERILTEAEINRLIERRQKTVAALKESGMIVAGQEENVKVTKDQEDKWGDAMTGALLNKPVNGVQPFYSLRESFRVITGYQHNEEKTARLIMNDLSKALTPDLVTHEQSEWRSILRESRLKAVRLKEASLATTTWAEVFGDSVRRALIAYYQQNADWATWRQIVSEISSASDFRTMRRVRVGGLVDLQDVAELGTYQEITLPGDEEETFAVTKVGNLFSYSMESAMNDDLGALRRIPMMIGYAAARTLYKDVFDVLRSNPTMGDGTALFHADHGNLGSTALSDVTLAAAILAMRDQTELSSSETMGGFIQPKFVVIPNELEKLAWELARSNVSQTTGTSRAETVSNWFLSFGLTLVHPISYWTDTNNWYVVADPSIMPTIEVAFLNGRQEPEILLQDQPTLGSVFTADKLTFKGRFIYGVKALDHRGLYGAVVG